MNHTNNIELDAARYRWLNEKGRSWTFWLGRSHGPYSHTTWPVFPCDDLSAAIDDAMEREAMQKARAVQV